MVKRALLVLVLLTLAVLGLSSPANAWNFPGSNDSTTSTGDTNSASGQSQWGQARGCALYATPYGFGLQCVHGGSGDVQTKTVKEVLDGDKAPNCWDEKMSRADQAASRAGDPAPGGTTYYIHYCITHLDPNAPVGTQGSLQLNQEVVEIPNDAPHCPSPQPVARKGTCVMTLTGNQHAIVDLSALAAAQIPDVLVQAKPSTRVRTNQQVTFTDVAAGGQTKTDEIDVGGVRMWAAMGSFSIQPYGAGTSPTIPCDLGATGGPSCAWTYPKSSAQQPHQAYPFRAEADWTVYVDAGGGPTAFASFRKYDDLKMPVFDVQTLVVN